MSEGRESIVRIMSRGKTALGVLHSPGGQSQTGVIIAVGGPQYRVGSHRQFVQMARAICAAGFPVMRFDFQGMGDSDGEWPGFEHVGGGLSAAIEAYSNESPAVQRIVLLGLCDAASAIMMNCAADARVAGVVLLNPWARSGHGEAKAYIKHYYGQRLLQASFWRKVFSGRFELGSSLRGFRDSLLAAGGGRGESSAVAAGDASTFIDAMLQGLLAYRGKALLLISGNDLTAREFTDLVDGSKHWTKRLQRADTVTIRMQHADHTFSSSSAMQDGIDSIVGWLREHLPQ